MLHQRVGMTAWATRAGPLALEASRPSSSRAKKNVYFSTHNYLCQNAKRRGPVGVGRTHVYALSRAKLSIVWSLSVDGALGAPVQYYISRQYIFFKL